MPFSLLDFKKNCTCDGMNFAHLTWLMILHYLVKLEASKMHLNTNSAFNVNYERNSRQMHQVTLTVSKNVLMNHMIQIN